MKTRFLRIIGVSEIGMGCMGFTALERALDTCKVHGHRGYVETEQVNFSRNWKEK